MEIFLICFNKKSSEFNISDISQNRTRLLIFNSVKRMNNKFLSSYAKYLVKYIASTRLNVDISCINFSYGKNGKPYIEDYPNFQFNISHTKDSLVVVITDISVGIDIEKLEPAMLKIANRFFSKEEQNYIYLSNDNQNKRFFEIWTKKEAYIKWTGKGLSQSLSSFDVTTPEISKLLSTFEIDEYIISVCTERK